MAEEQEGEAGEQSLFAKLVENAKKLQVLFMRASGIKDRDLR